MSAKQTKEQEAEDAVAAQSAACALDRFHKNFGRSAVEMAEVKPYTIEQAQDIAANYFAQAKAADEMAVPGPEHVIIEVEAKVLEHYAETVPASVRKRYRAIDSVTGDELLTSVEMAAIQKVHP